MKLEASIRYGFKKNMGKKWQPVNWLVIRVKNFPTLCTKKGAQQKRNISLSNKVNHLQSVFIYQNVEYFLFHKTRLDTTKT